MTTLTRERRDWTLLIFIILIGIILMLIAGQIAIHLAPFWSVTANMRSNLDPNLASKRQPGFVQPLAPGILTPYDINLTPDEGSVVFPPFIVFELNNTPSVTVSPRPAASSTIQPTDSPLPTKVQTATSAVTKTPTKIITATPIKTIAATATATKIATVTNTSTKTPTPTPTVTRTATVISISTATPTRTATVISISTATPTRTATVISISTATPTRTATRTATVISIVTATPTSTSTPILTLTPTLTSTLTSTVTVTMPPTPTATGTATSTAINTVTPTPTPTIPAVVSTLDSSLIWIPPPPVGAPDSAISPVSGGYYTIVNLGSPLEVVGTSEKNYDFVYYEAEWNNSGFIYLDNVIVGISEFPDAHIFFEVLNWGNNARDTNTNVDTNILPPYSACSDPLAPECANRSIPLSSLYPYPGTGITIDIDNAPSAPPVGKKYQYIVIICPVGYPEAANIDSIEILPP